MEIFPKTHGFIKFISIFIQFSAKNDIDSVDLVILSAEDCLIKRIKEKALAIQKPVLFGEIGDIGHHNHSFMGIRRPSKICNFI
jgi:hypothetical protein